MRYETTVPKNVAKMKGEFLVEISDDNIITWNKFQPRPEDQCPTCGQNDVEITNVDLRPKNDSIRSYRCNTCGQKFTNCH